jgi:hypothetical protein
VSDDPISLLFVTLVIKAIAYFFVIRFGIVAAPLITSTAAP